MSIENNERLRRVVAARLESLEQAGVLELPKARIAKRVRQAEPQTQARQSSAAAEVPAVTQKLSAATTTTTVTIPKTTSTIGAGWKSPAEGALFEVAEGSAREISSASTLEVLQQEVAACTRCDELAKTRTQTVFGVGNPQARLCFLGEAPGADEDRLGEPFVGRAGQLLNKIIEACKLRREDVYICNILKCRPPGNRNPLPSEAANCRRFLERQLELVAPEFICCLGTVAAQNLLATPVTIGKLRGRVHTFRGAKVICTYHPAYLLRNPEAKKDTWEDMKFLMREMGVEL
jgi:DNA polymerase